MAFKSISEYNDDRYHGMFMLKNDKDYADVIFLYRNINDVLVANTHYIKSSNYNGYVHCLGFGCPACEKEIRIQPKLFVPLYVIESDDIQFWDRSIKFNQILDSEVFSKYPNPSEYVFRITRNGAAGDINTRYSIVGIGKNGMLSYDEILKHKDVKMPDYFDTICKEWSVDDFNENLSSSTSTSVDIDSMPEYKLSPRVSTSSNSTVELPDLPDITEPDGLADINADSSEVTVDGEVDPEIEGVSF